MNIYKAYDDEDVLLFTTEILYNCFLYNQKYFKHTLHLSEVWRFFNVKLLTDLSIQFFSLICVCVCANYVKILN